MVLGFVSKIEVMLEMAITKGMALANGMQRGSFDLIKIKKRVHNFITF